MGTDVLFLSSKVINDWYIVITFSLGHGKARGHNSCVRGRFCRNWTRILVGVDQ